MVLAAKVSVVEPASLCAVTLTSYSVSGRSCLIEKRREYGRRLFDTSVHDGSLGKVFNVT